MAAVDGLTTSPLPGILLRVEGDAGALGHLRSEYGDDGGSSARPVSAELVVRFVNRLSAPGLTDAHKTVRWSARLERPEEHRLILSVALRGWPRWFGLSLVQGYLVEPALSLLAIEAGGVLLSAAAVVQNGSALLLVGGSGSGKSSLALRSLAAGIGYLGDDQVFVAADGTCWRFPRRLRLYDDARRTAPEAVACLPTAVRRQLSLRGLLRAFTRGLVAPSLAVPAAEVRGSVLTESAPLGQVVLLARGSGTQRLERRAASVGEAIDECLGVATAQRERLRRALGDGWSRSFARVEERERALLEEAFAGVPISRLVSPDIGARAAIDAVAAELGLP
jgi:hypothetical protein